MRRRSRSTTRCEARRSRLARPTRSGSGSPAREATTAWRARASASTARSGQGAAATGTPGASITTVQPTAGSRRNVTATSRPGCGAARTITAAPGVSGRRPTAASALTNALRTIESVRTPVSTNAAGSGCTSSPNGLISTGKPARRAIRTAADAVSATAWRVIGTWYALSSVFVG